MGSTSITLESVKTTIADVLERQLGIAPEHSLSGAPFTELDKNFDSLTFVETQLMIEEEYGVQFDQDLVEKAERPPKNVHELAELLLPQILEGQAKAA